MSGVLGVGAGGGQEVRPDASAQPPSGSADRSGPSIPVRTQLAALVGRGVSWRTYNKRIPPGLRAGRPAAVLVLFGVLDGTSAHHHGGAVPADLDVLLVGRASTLTHHSGQVAFPGGRVDPADTGPISAAVREAVEETGLDAAGVDVLGTLGELPVPVSNHLVTPVLAWWATPSPVDVVDLGESATVFRAPVADLLDPDLRRTATLRRGPLVHRTPAFLVGPHVVWGFTAIVLNVLFDELGWTEPWDESRTIDVAGSGPR